MEGRSRDIQNLCLNHNAMINIDDCFAVLPE